MLFNSIDFALFLPVVFLLYWFLFQGNLKKQNLFVVLVSYLFYGWWDWRFLFLILFSTLIDYFVGISLQKENKVSKRKWLLWASILGNLGFLGFFKYFNFFLENFTTAFSFFGAEIPAQSLNIILPVGISFYTFQTLSYTIDIYRRELEPTKDFIAFAAFVSFFPQLVAGPIERAKNLLPQFQARRSFDETAAVSGLRQILWGLFMKVVVADNCAQYADLIFSNSEAYGGSTLFLGALFFTFQIYGDFSGYSNIAIGTARLFGFNLMQNFAFPYFSRDIAEFWRRWHISLSTWFRDYLYIPLGGSRTGKWKGIRNVFIIFLVSGFWHGANWTFIIWGAINAACFLPLFLLDLNRNNLDVIAQNSALPSIRNAFSMLATFGITVIAWIFFRADNVTQAITMIIDIFSPSLFSTPDFPGMGRAAMILPFLIFFLYVEWVERRQKFALENFGLSWPRFLRWIFYILIAASIPMFGVKEQQFIYFQF